MPQNSSDAHYSEISTRIREFQSQQLSNTMKATWYLGVMATLISISRAFFTGFKLIYLVQFVFTVAILLVVIFRKKIGYNALLASLISTSFLTGISALLAFGTLSPAIFLLSLSCILASTFTSRKNSVYTLSVCILAINICMYLHLTGRVRIVVDPLSYLNSPYSWILLICGFGIITGFVTSLTSNLNQHLKTLVIESSQHLAKVKDANQNLEKIVMDRTAELKQSNEEKNRIMRFVAHDLNNSLCGIVGTLEYLNLGWREFPEDTRLRNINSTIQAALKAAQTVQELVTYSGIKNEKNEDIMESVEMGQFINSIVACHYPNALKKNIILELCNVNQSLYCRINKSRVSRLFENLITNSIKFTPRGGSITLDLSSGQGSVITAVKDTGIGIPKEMQKMLFEPHGEFRRRGTEDEESTGLGLKIVKEITMQHGGDIWMESEEGAGTTFYVRFPVAEKV